MIEIISVEMAEEIIREHLGLFLELKKDGHYLLTREEERFTVSWTNSVPNFQFFENIQTLELGMVLIDTRRKGQIVLPAVMHRLEEFYPKIEVSNPKVAEKFTMGQPVKVHDGDQYETKQVIITYNNLPIAFGHILFGEFNPVIDVGWYLREAE